MKKKSSKKIYANDNSNDSSNSYSNSNDSINNNISNVDSKYYEDYQNSYDDILLSNLCINNEIKEDEDEKENDDIEFNHWFLMKITPFNVLALSLNILFLLVTGSVITSNLQIEGNRITTLSTFIGFEIGQWLFFSCLSILIFCWMYIVSIDTKNRNIYNISKANILQKWHSLSMAICFVRLLNICYKISTSNVFEVRNSAIYLTDNKVAEDSVLYTMYTTLFIQLIQLSFWVMCFSSSHTFIFFTSLEQVWIYLKLQSFERAFFSKPFFMKWLASASLGYLLILYFINFKTPSAFINSARVSWHYTRDQMRILKEKQAWFFMMCKDLKSSLQLIISPIKQIEKLPDYQGRRNIIGILHHTVIINSAVDNLILMSNIREKKQFVSEDVIDIERICTGITKYLPMALADQNDDTCLDDFMSYKFPNRLVQIQMNEVLFTSLIKNMILCTVNFLQNSSQYKGSSKKILELHIDLDVSPEGSMMIKCLVFFNIKPFNGFKCIQSDSIYIDSLQAVCNSIGGTCSVTDVSVKVTAPCKIFRRKEKFMNSSSNSTNSNIGKLQLFKNLSPRGSLVLYDDAELVEALSSCLENFMTIQTVDFHRRDDQLPSIIQSFDVIFVSSIELCEVVRRLKNSGLVILYLGASAESESTTLKSKCDYVLYIPCLPADVEHLLHYVATHYFSTRNNVLRKEGIFSKMETNDIKEDSERKESESSGEVGELIHRSKSKWFKTITKGLSSLLKSKHIKDENYNYLDRKRLFMNVFSKKVEEEYLEWMLLDSKTYINSCVVFVIVLPLLSNIRLMTSSSDPEPEVQAEQKKFLQKPIYIVVLILICIAIVRRKFIHVNGYSLYKYWKGVAAVITVGNIIVTISMMIQCYKGKCSYVYPSNATLKSSNNVFLETFGNWPGVGLVVLTLALQIFIRVIWCFYLPWPWSIYLMLAVVFRLSVIGSAFKALFVMHFYYLVGIVVAANIIFGTMLIYTTEFFHRNEFRMHKNIIRSSEFMEKNIPQYLATLESSISVILDSSKEFIDSAKNQIFLQNLQLTREISDSFGKIKIGFLKLQEIRDIILLKKMCDTKVVVKAKGKESCCNRFFNCFNRTMKTKNNLKVEETITNNTNNMNDTIFLVREVQKLVSVFNANYHDQIQVYILVQPDINVIFSNKLFCISAISNFLYNSFQNIKRKLRLFNKDIQEIVMYFRTEKSSINKSYTSTKQIRVDIFDTGYRSNSLSRSFPIMIWSQLSEEFGISQSFSFGSINHHVYKNTATIFLPFRQHPILLSTKRDLLSKNIFRISKTHEEILKLRVGYNVKDHVWKDSLTDHSKIEKSSVLVVFFDERDDQVVKSSRREYFYSEEWNIKDILTFKKFDYSCISSIDCIILDFKNYLLSKKFIGHLAFFFNTLAVMRYDMIIVALLDENDIDEPAALRNNCNYIIKRPLQNLHIINILEKIRMRKLECILSIQ